jgi:flavodoxin
LRTLLVLRSYHHKNTEKIAHAMARVLEAPIRGPEQIDPEEVRDYDLIGFGSGIYSDRHHGELLGLSERLPSISGKKAFLFSTNGSPAGAMGEAGLKEYVTSTHAPLRKILESKGYVIVGEFGCSGFNTNSFLRFFGGLNKGRPNAEDIEHAEEFARALLTK